jgi:hypothetical protein
MAAACGGIEVPIRAAKVVAGTVAQGARNAINGSRAAFELEEHAHWSFVQIDGQAGEAKTGAIFLVTEGWAKANSAKQGRPAAGNLQGKLRFDFDLIARGGPSGDGDFGSESSAGAPGGDVGACRRGLDADAKETAEMVQLRTSCIVKRVLLKDAAVANDAKGTQALEQRRNIRDPEFYLDFGMRERGHSRPEYIRGTRRVARGRRLPSGARDRIIL